MKNLVVHKVHGLCEILDTIEMNDESYYKIKVLSEDSLILYCPVSKKATLCRPLLTKEEIFEVLEYMRTIKDVKLDFSKQRRTHFKELLYSGNGKKIGYLTKVLYIYKEYKDDKNQTLGLEDTRMLDTAKRMITEEISAVLEISEDETVELIKKYIKD